MIGNAINPLLDEAAAVQLADALALSRTLTRLKLCGVCFWDDAAAAAAVMRALTGHPCLQEVDLSCNDPPDADQFAAGVALGALVSVNAPSLTSLTLSSSDLGDAGLGPLFYALPRNAHLRELYIEDTFMSEAFARHTLLPSVRANRSLRELAVGAVGPNDPTSPEVLEAEALVVARRTA